MAKATTRLSRNNHLSPTYCFLRAIDCLILNRVKSRLRWKWAVVCHETARWSRSRPQNILTHSSSSLNVNLQVGGVCVWDQPLTSTPTHTVFLFSCRTSWDGHRLGACRSIGLNWWRIVPHPSPPQSCCLRQSVMHSCKIETGWKRNNGRFYRKKACAGLGLKVLRKEDEEKNVLHVALRRANGLGLMTSL